MMATTIRQKEALPAAYPDIPDNLSAAAAALDPAFIWQRIEDYTAYRWSERAVEFIAEGPGHWEAPLSPVTIATAEVWRNEAWEALTLPASPFGGYVMAGCGPYRFAGTVGDDDADVPAGVMEAFRRLAEYMASKPDVAGATRSLQALGPIRKEHERAADWMARAIVNSGAGDLLRAYRRAA
jgi:hypothetical protein